MPTCRHTQDRLQEMKLPTLEERRERGDLITIYKLVNDLEKIDRRDLLLEGHREAGCLRGHGKKLRKGICLKNIKKFSFPHRNIDTWNGLIKK